MNKKEFRYPNGEHEDCLLAIVNVIINGEEKEIIPAFTKFSINRKDFSRNTIFEHVDKSKILPTVFSFTKPKAFQEENVPLFDYFGTEIPVECYEHTLVYLDKADNINLFGVLEEPLNSTLIKCESVQEAYNYVATSFFLSHCPTKNEWIGVVLGATQDNILKDILEFANEHKMNGTTAQAYFGLSYKVKALQKAAITKVSPHDDSNYRSKEEASILYEAVKGKFGAKCAGQTRYIKALNTSINHDSFEEVVEAIKQINDSDKELIIHSSSEEKCQVIQKAITERITLRKNVA